MEEDLSCPICLRLLYKPSSIICGHTFCKQCIEKSLESTSHCPICRKLIPRPLSLSPSYLINNLLQKNYPEEFKKREKEEKKKDNINKLPDYVPVFFIIDLVHVPGESFTFLLSFEKDYNYFRSITNEKKEFAICSEVNKKKVFWLSRFELLKSMYGVHFVNAKVLCRLNPSFFLRSESPQYKININEFSLSEFNDKSLFLVPVVKLEDKVVKIDKVLEDSLMKFTQDCVSKLTSFEVNIFNEVKPSNTQTSFYIMSLLKIPVEILLECFLLNNENHRLKLIDEYFRGKVPCRLHIKFARSAQFPALYTFFIVFVFLLWVLLDRVFRKSS